LLLIFICLVILFSIWSTLVGGQFFKASTFRNILSSLTFSAFLTIGAGCLLISGHIDLSQAAVGAFGGMMLAVAIKCWDVPWFLAIILGLLLCVVFGALNATLVTYFRFPPFIATLSMHYMARGLMFIFSTIDSTTGSAVSVAFINKPIAFLGSGMIGPIPFGIIVMAVFFLIYGIIIARTRFGMKVILLGGNPVAANLAGVKARKMTYILFINGAVLGGVAGIFNTGQLSQGSLLALQNNQFSGITAAILGGISFVGGSGGMGGAFIGLLILNTFQIGMGSVKITNPFWVSVFMGILLIAALAADFLSQMRIKKRLNV